MNTLIASASLLVPLLLALLVIAAALYLPRRPKLVALANVAEGRWPGHKSYYTDAAFTAPNLLCKAGSDDRHIAICTASDIPRGVVDDEAEAAEDLVNVRLLGLVNETELGVASGSISEGEFLVAAAAGAVRTLPAGAGTYYIIGIALADAADTATVQYAPMAPVQRVVAG